MLIVGFKDNDRVAERLPGKGVAVEACVSPQGRLFPGRTRRSRQICCRYVAALEACWSTALLEVWLRVSARRVLWGKPRHELDG